jgi:hypothetical protein
MEGLEIMDKPLHTLSLTEAAEGIKNRRFTSEAYTKALLDGSSRSMRESGPGPGSNRRRRSRPPGSPTTLFAPTAHPAPSRGFPWG